MFFSKKNAIGTALLFLSSTAHSAHGDANAAGRWLLGRPDGYHSSGGSAVHPRHSEREGDETPSLSASLECGPTEVPISGFRSSPSSQDGQPILIAMGGTVVFEDTSKGCPNAWSWKVIGGTAGVSWNYVNSTSGSSQHPQIAFYTVGTYGISLTASNANGSGGTEEKSAYIQVVEEASGSACDTLRNYQLSEPISAFDNENGWGYFPGHGAISSEKIVEYAEPHRALKTVKVKGVRFRVRQLDNISGFGNVRFHVRKDAYGKPGESLTSEDVSFNSLKVGVNTIYFSNYITVTGNFWVGAELFYTSYQDTLVLGAATGNRPAGVGTIKMREKDSVAWHGTDRYYVNGINVSIAWDVLLSNAPDPVAQFTTDSTQICVNKNSVVDASASTTVNDYLWQLKKAPYGEIVDTASTVGHTFANLDTGSYTVYLDVTGACKTSSATPQAVKVYANTIAAVDSIGNDAGTNNGSIDLETSGGLSPLTFKWSDDQTSKAISNLAAGEYTVVITDAAGCTFTETYEVISTASIEDATGDALLVFPNPTEGVLHVQHHDQYVVTVLDATGRTLVRQTAYVDADIDLSQFDSGLYAVAVQKGGAQIIRKVVKY